MFKKVLVANRGEIALRIMRCLREMGIDSVAIHSPADADCPHVRYANEAVMLDGDSVASTYLDVEQIVKAALSTGAEAIHPGYGFLAERAAFARRIAEEGLVFIGPSPEAIESMGSKVRARELMSAAGVPVVPGTLEPVTGLDEAARSARDVVGYPVAVKASGAGGGKGFRVAHSEDELKDALEGAAGEGERFFSDSSVYLERYLEDPRHVEVQVLADSHGNVIHLGERDCSIQRRHQKLIEEAPAPAVDEALRSRIGEIAVQAARAVGYQGAGTVEGLLVDGQYYFLEMNTRVQVEHPVTELVTGVDIVRESIRVAAGERLAATQDDVNLRGHAIECRINAEDASKNFLPTPGAITSYREPSGPGVRVDSGVEAGSVVTPTYDPMISKLIVWDIDREAATARMLRALDEYEIGGLRTLLPFHKALLRTAQWQAGATARDLIADKAWLKELAFPKPNAEAAASRPSASTSPEPTRSTN
jgi:acetyl-CoA/propionyl-CoA carboxylase biotin carboxyl carrier protein